MNHSISNGGLATEGNKFANSFHEQGEMERLGNRPHVNDFSRFFGRIERHENGCWLWRGSFNTNGYGVFFDSVKGIAHGAHVVAYEWFVGDVPAGMELDHTCRIRACVNPAHVEPVTHSENQRRAGLLRVLCRNGHRWIPENIVTASSGRGRRSQTCRLCRDASNKRWRALAREAKRHG